MSFRTVHTIGTSSRSISSRSAATRSARSPPRSESSRRFELEGTMRILFPAFILFSGCALLDGIKDGKFCAIPGDADPTLPANSEPPNCGRTGTDRFASASYLTSFLASETRELPIAVVERGGSTSDDPVALEVASGAWMVRETGEGTREEATIGSDSAVITRRILRITAPDAGGAEHATLRYKGAQGETAMELGL